MNDKKQTLALFDFDKTITSTDSFVVFMKYTLGIPRCFFGFLILSPVLIAFLLKIINNYTTKEIVTRFFFKNWTMKRFQDAADRFVAEKLPSLIRESARERIVWHKDQGHRVFIVSASFEYWLKPWGEKMGMEVIGTKLSTKEGRLTGKFSTPNCFGPEKVRRIKEVVDMSMIDRIYAYGDSRGDKEMLEMADEPYFRWLKDN